MKKTIASLLCLSVMSAFAANPIKPDSVRLHELQPWQAVKPYDGRVFLLIPEDQKKWVIHVNETLANGQIPDAMTVDCNEVKYRLTAGESIECFSEFSYLTLEQEDFKNGSEGTYSLEPQK